MDWTTHAELGFWQTTVGKKVVMAVTGVIMILFLVAHLAGNLLVFVGAARFDAYAALLQDRSAIGKFVRYDVEDIHENMSVLEVLDVLNDRLVAAGHEPVAFDSDCREGICGTCGVMIDGVAHGPLAATTTCEIYMRHFRDGATIRVEPWRAASFPIIKDLVVDRSAFDRIIAAGGFISANTGSAPEANTILVPKHVAEAAMDAAACIGCGACVAACPNASASLFTAAKITHLGLLPQGRPERAHRVPAMVGRMDEEGFGNCTWHGECQAACPKAISIDTIARMNGDWLRASLSKRPSRQQPENIT